MPRAQTFTERIYPSAAKVRGSVREIPWDTQCASELDADLHALFKAARRRL